MANQIKWIWTEKQHIRWESTRQKGRGRFILYSGVLGWGGCMFLSMSILRSVFGFSGYFAAIPWYWTWNVVLWAAVGFIFGFLTWIWSEKLYLGANTYQTWLL